MRVGDLVTGRNHESPKVTPIDGSLGFVIHAEESSDIVKVLHDDRILCYFISELRVVSEPTDMMEV